MKKTKIICSVGPSCESVEVMEDMVHHGMNCARINLSHATHEDCEKTIDVVRKVRKNTLEPIAIMYDTKGPEFRTLEFENEGIQINTGETIWMVKESVVGNSSQFSVNHPEAIDYIKGVSKKFDDSSMFVSFSGGKDSLTLKEIGNRLNSSEPKNLYLSIVKNFIKCCIE